MKHSRIRLTGIWLMTKASVAFSLMALCVKLASRTLPSLEIVFFRSLFGSLLLFGLMRAKGIPIFGRERSLLILRGLAGFLALSLHFYTIARLPLGTAVTLNYTSPIFSALFAVSFLGERPSGTLLSAILISFAGVYLVVGGRFESFNAPVLLGLLSAVFAATAYVSIRAIEQRESSLTIIFAFTSISTVGSVFFLPFGFRWPDLAGWPTLFGVGIGSFYGQLWMTRSLKQAPASLVTPFSYLTPLLTFFYGLTFLSERMTPTALLGAFLILAGIFMISRFATVPDAKKTLPSL